MFEAEGFYSVFKKAVKKLILPLVAEIKEHITNERITLMGQFDASNERLSAAVTNQLKQTADALQALVDSDAEKEELKAEVQAQVTQLNDLSTQLESDDPVVEPDPVVTDPTGPGPVDPGAELPVEEPTPAPVEEQPVVEEPAPAQTDLETGSDVTVGDGFQTNMEVPDPNGPPASH